MSTETTRMRWGYLLAVAGSLSIGWGIRGNYGHEYGAMMPGALAAMAAVLLSGREDWHRRIAWFAFFGALGWSFGGSMSYMQVIGYTHSGHGPSVVYGFASLFLLGLLWGAPGGAGTALPAVLSPRQLTDLLRLCLAIFAGWMVQDLVVDAWFSGDTAYRHQDPLYWYDTDWVAATVALLVTGGWILLRRAVDPGASLVLHMGVGWWAGFMILVNLLGLRMTPPRGDNWAGCVGMVIGMWIWLARNGQGTALMASLVTGIVGGLGFAGAQILKLAGLSTGLHTNWHSVLEQTYGWINGLGVALGMVLVARQAPVQQPGASRRGDGQGFPAWTHAFLPWFLLIVVTYINLKKNPISWLEAKTTAPEWYGMSVRTWFLGAYALIGIAVAAILLRAQRGPLAILPTSSVGRGMGLYLIFLWWIVIGNFERALPGFAQTRLITEGVVFVHAILCTLLLLMANPLDVPVGVTPMAGDGVGRSGAGGAWGKWAGAGLLACLLVTVGGYCAAKALFGDAQAPGAAKNIRFGPNATAVSKPMPGKPHP